MGEGKVLQRGGGLSERDKNEPSEGEREEEGWLHVTLPCLSPNKQAWAEGGAVMREGVRCCSASE